MFKASCSDMCVSVIVRIVMDVGYVLVSMLSSLVVYVFIIWDGLHDLMNVSGSSIILCAVILLVICHLSRVNAMCRVSCHVIIGLPIRSKRLQPLHTYTDASNLPTRSRLRPSIN